MAVDYEWFKGEVYKLTKIDLNAYKEKQMKRRIDTLIGKTECKGYDQYMDLMEPYAYEGLENFQEKYMSGFLGEKYNRSEEELAPRAIEKIKTAIEGLINASITGYTTVTKNSMDASASKKKVEYALLPVWEYVFRYKNENYKFHVNGQTGKVVGKTPVAKNKVVVYGATVFGLITLVGSMIRMLVAAIM